MSGCSTSPECDAIFDNGGKSSLYFSTHNRAAWHSQLYFCISQLTMVQCCIVTSKQSLAIALIWSNSPINAVTIGPSHCLSCITYTVLAVPSTSSFSSIFAKIPNRREVYKVNKTDISILHSSYM